MSTWISLRIESKFVSRGTLAGQQARAYRVARSKRANKLEPRAQLNASRPSVAPVADVRGYLLFDP